MHTAGLASLPAPQRDIPLAGALLLTGVLGAMVVLQHAHYSIDVLVAPFVVFAVWSFVVAMHKHDWRAAGLAQHGPGWGPIVRHRGDRKEN